MRHIISGFGQQQRGYRNILGSQAFVNGPVSDSVLVPTSGKTMCFMIRCFVSNPRSSLKLFVEKNVCCGGEDFNAGESENGFHTFHQWDS